MNAITAIILAALSFSFYPLLNAISLEAVSPFLLALLVQLSTIFTGLMAFLFNCRSLSKLRSLVSDYNVLPFEYKMVPVLSGIGIYLGGIFFIFALSLMSKAGASLIMEMWPVLAIFIAPLVIFKKWVKLGAMDVVLIFISLAGLLFITASEKQVTFEQFLTNPLLLFNNQDFYGYIGIIVAFLSAFCFATSSIARSFFASILPIDFRRKYFGRENTIIEATFIYLLTYLWGLPLAFLSFLFMEDAIIFEMSALAPIFAIGLVLVATSSLYSYALLIADNPNINLLWYFAPLLAAVWLAVAGYSEITEMLMLGGSLIILANVILILKSREKAAHV